MQSGIVCRCPHLSGGALFVVLHIVGARYIYSYVPYADWFKNIGFNAEFCHSLGESRNHYDRLVHFSFGLFLFSFFQYKTQKWVDRKPLAAIFMAWLVIQTLSMVYEIFEWLLTIWSEAGWEYNGQQGDPWDAQKDMMLNKEIK